MNLILILRDKFIKLDNFQFAQMSKKIDSDILPYERSIADFANKLNAKDEEISSLKIQLASK